MGSGRWAPSTPKTSGGLIIDRKTLIILIIIAATAAALAAGTVLISNNGGNDDGTFSLKYFGDEVTELSVPSGTSVTVAEFVWDYPDGFIGWNTKVDFSGETFLPGSEVTVDEDLVLYPMFRDTDGYRIILPEEQEGFTIEADPSEVDAGGSSTLEYILKPSHVDYDLNISVNGNPMKLDAFGRIYLSDIREDQIVTVTGVYDRREHSITLPVEQRGYVLTSSAEKVHDKQSYTLEYRLLPGYGESPDFGIAINDGAPVKLSGGVLLVEDVRDNHVITVTGVGPVLYEVTAGRNIAVLVNGESGTKATVEDRITVAPALGYVLPKTFDGQIEGEYTRENGEYRISGNISFPSVLKITAGDNVRIAGSSSESVFVCQGDAVPVSPAPGYALPANYADAVMNQTGATSTAKGFLFTNNSTLPSIYRVVFNSYNGIYKTTYEVGGTIAHLPEDVPKRVAYNFGGWDINLNSTITSNKIVNSIWIPMTFEVYFGPNLIAIVGTNVYTFVEGAMDAPRTIQIKSNEQVIIKNRFDLGLPDNYGPQTGQAHYVDGHFEIIENCSFPGITYVEYFKSDMDNYYVSVIIGSGYTPISEPLEDKNGYSFQGWLCDGELIISQVVIENRVYFLSASWK